jgi:Glycosyl hydrolases family 18
MLKSRARRCASTAFGLVGLFASTLSIGPTAKATVAETVSPTVAPYLEMAGPNIRNLSAAMSAGLHSVTAAFVIGNGCTPVWDDQEAVATDTAAARTIKGAQRRGAHVIVSFGGAGGIDLARSCNHVRRLTAAYQSVVTKFHVKRIDFDVEGAALNPSRQQSSISRRFAAIRALESHNPGLVVSATIPVGQRGLLPSGLSFLRMAKSSRTRIDLVNIMTMDYGVAVTHMGAAAIHAAQHSVTQIKSIWPRDSYANLGITPMIGRNDSAGEILTLSQASRIVAFAKEHSVGRLAFWSLNRDQRCPAGTPATAQDSCSGAHQRPEQFTRVFLASS